jgi:hypothetical protein
MRTLIIILTLSFFSLTSNGQYPFEKYSAINYKTYADWVKWDKEDRVHETLLIPNFYQNGDSLIVQLTSFGLFTDSSFIRLYRNNSLIQKIFEPCSLQGIEKGNTLMIADINGDSLPDIKLIASLPYCGISGLARRVVYLFQKNDTSFTKISFTDMFLLNENWVSRPERDFDNDNNYEIITMTLNNFKNHNYWTFNLYDYKDENIICVNDKFDYPIMIQYLFNDNYTVTDKISKEKMKDFSDRLPLFFDRKD